MEIKELPLSHLFQSYLPRVCFAKDESEAFYKYRRGPRLISSILGKVNFGALQVNPSLKTIYTQIPIWKDGLEPKLYEL